MNGLRYFDGKVFDGYIRGAEVFVDTNDNLSLDPNEASVTTDNQGSFTKLLFGNGTLVSKGGFDLDTGADLPNLTLVHKLDGYEDSKLASPFSTIIAYMSDASIINAALGIDASIDLINTDPIPNLGDGIYDQMYEKGNQLTVLSYTLQNHSNAVDGNSKIYFQAIADQLEESYGANQESVDIENPTFITNVINKVEAARNTTFESDVKTNLSTIISSTIPLLKVYPDSNTTSSVQRFAFSTLQNDVKDSTVMTGNASPTLLKYENNIYDYVASDQGISESDITPIDNTEVDEPISNQAPTINSSATFSLAENNIAIGDISASDPDGDSLTYSISGSEINISNSGALTFASAPDYETKNSYSATVTVSDGAKSTTQNISVTITDVDESIPNQAPTINSSATFSLAENNIAIGDISASDPDGDSLTYSISGSEINISNSGALTFASAPDYETKNSYSASVTVSDSITSTSQEITVNISDENEAPIINSSATFAADENQVSIGDISSSDPDGDSLTYSISGSEINISNSGALTFASAPDYETKNSYSATVTVSDGAKSTTQGITVNIGDINLSASQIGSNIIGEANNGNCYKCI
ncbi:cadherin repeat domain-containing protein, partial [bacterium]|nr:cadherin repeat domain-containing protein [bacterium]